MIYAMDLHKTCSYSTIRQLSGIPVLDLQLGKVMRKELLNLHAQDHMYSISSSGTSKIRTTWKRFVSEFGAFIPSHLNPRTTPSSPHTRIAWDPSSTLQHFTFIPSIQHNKQISGVNSLCL